MANKNTKKYKQEHRKKRASALLSVFGVLGFTSVTIASFITKSEISGFAMAFFAAVSIPPEVLRRVLRAITGNEK